MVLTLCDSCLQPFLDDPNYKVRFLRNCRPCAEDASHTGMVLAYKASLNAVTVVKWGYCTPKAYPYWMPYPASPHNENREG